jgi:hypothetical protein
LPSDIPKAPWHVYADNGWNGIGDWLGTGHVANQDRRYCSYAQARSFVVKLYLRSGREWTKYTKGQRKDLPVLPKNIPSAPQRVYSSKGWKGMGHWLGTGSVRNQDIVYLPFLEARTFVRGLRLRNRAEWFEYWKANKPAGLPRNAQQTYISEGWRGWGDWLGTGNLRNADRRYRDFKEARQFARRLKLPTQTAWRAFSKEQRSTRKALPQDIPRRPDHCYKSKGWVSWSDWLGTDRRGKAKRRR